MRANRRQLLIFYYLSFNNKSKKLASDKGGFQLVDLILTELKDHMICYTPVITLFISGLASRVLKLSFLSLIMMVKSGLEFILKFTEPLQRYLLSCQANSAILGRYFCTGQQQLWSGSVNFKINSRPLLTIIFKLKNDNFKTRDFSPLLKRVITGVSSLEFEMNNC